MQISKHNLVQLDFELTDTWNETPETIASIYSFNELEVVFHNKLCVNIELNKYQIEGVRSIQGLEKLISLVYG
tara:strand:- start:261 stop:479 length:219 start_codon:yes stop_codon:yes gene_type:complete